MALPLGLLSGASLPARRGALRTLLEMLLAADQAPMRQVAPACHTLLQPAVTLREVRMRASIRYWVLRSA